MSPDIHLCIDVRLGRFGSPLAPLVLPILGTRRRAGHGCVVPILEVVGLAGLGGLRLRLEVDDNLFLAVPAFLLLAVAQIGEDTTSRRPRRGPRLLLGTLGQRLAVLRPADLQLDGLALVAPALVAGPVAVGDRFQRRVEAGGVVEVLAIVTRERQVILARRLGVADLAGASLAVHEGRVVEAFFAESARSLRFLRKCLEGILRTRLSVNSSHFLFLRSRQN